MYWYWYDQVSASNLSCKPPITAFAFRSDLDANGGLDPYNFFPLFITLVKDVIAPKWSAVIRIMLKAGSFTGCWWSAKIIPVLNCSFSPLMENSRHISITFGLSKVYERLV